MAEQTIREEAGVWELSPTATAQERARQLYRRAGQLRQRRERLP